MNGPSSVPLYDKCVRGTRLCPHRIIKLTNVSSVVRNQKEVKGSWDIELVWLIWQSGARRNSGLLMKTLHVELFLSWWRLGCPLATKISYSRTEFKAWIRSYIHIKLSDIITHPRLNSNGSLAKRRFKSWHRWAMTPRRKLCYYLSMT